MIAESGTAARRGQRRAHAYTSLLPRRLVKSRLVLAGGPAIVGSGDPLRCKLGEPTSVLRESDISCSVREFPGEGKAGTRDGDTHLMKVGSLSYRRGRLCADFPAARPPQLAVFLCLCFVANRRVVRPYFRRWRNPKRPVLLSGLTQNADIRAFAASPMRAGCSASRQGPLRAAASGPPSLSRASASGDGPARWQPHARTTQSGAARKVARTSWAERLCP